MIDLTFSTKEEADKYLLDIRSSFGPNVAGLDEVGRGPVAGPVVVGCVVLPNNHTIKGIRDSKKLSAKRREAIAEEIMAVASYGIGTCEPEEIDEINVYQAARKAAVAALKECCLSIDPDYLLCDGSLYMEGMVITPTSAVIKGDQWFECISAASIVAKVYHDRQMAVYHEMWPMYGFDTNMGYGTSAHLDAIRAHGLSPIHRKTFGICRLINRENGDVLQEH